MPNRVRVAAIQLNSTDDLSANLAACEQWLLEAKAAGARLAVLPENFAFFGPEARRIEHAEQLGDFNGPIQSALKRLAKSTQMAIVAGGWPEQSDEPARPYNALTVFDPEGAIAGHYRKLHLFDVDLANGTTYRESASTSAGGDVTVSTVVGINLGLSICYDLRFPELYRRLSELGAEVMCIPSAFTAETGRDHWHLLNRARAVESQAWVIAANQWGSHGKNRQTYGHSLIIDPWGTVVAEATDRPGIIVADLDLDWLASIRARLPALRHRRLGIERLPTAPV
ncbi:MAG TPA: carbon-nitrogen hydrolase family protein [Polyangiaceae bacterium]